MRRGFTLLEVIVAISIMILLASLLFPVFVSAKRASNRSSCMSNLKQLGMALTIYRGDVGGSEYGTPRQMGLPLHVLDLKVSSRDVLNCRGNNPEGNAFYENFPGETEKTRGTDEWSRYTASVGSSAVIYFDPNHQDSFPRSISWALWTVMGLRLDTSVVIKSRRGFPLYLRWWHS